MSKLQRANEPPFRERHAAVLVVGTASSHLLEPQLTLVHVGDRPRADSVHQGTQNFAAARHEETGEARRTGRHHEEGDYLRNFYLEVIKLDFRYVRECKVVARCATSVFPSIIFPHPQRRFFLFDFLLNTAGQYCAYP